jgi:hypothetical protein
MAVKSLAVIALLVNDVLRTGERPNPMAPGVLRALAGGEGEILVLSLQ